MRRLSFRSVLITVAAGFFVLGVVSTIFRPAMPSSPGATAAPTQDAMDSTPAAETPQLTVLILGVDSLELEAPQLRAVWFALVRPPGTELFLLGLPVDRPAHEGSTLEQAFGWQDGLPTSFLEALSELTPLPIDVIVVLDSKGFATLIDFLGGVPTAGTTVDGAAALSVVDLLKDDPDASLQAQYRLLQALSAQVSVLQPGSDLQPLVDLIPAHAFVSLPVQQAIALVAPLLPLDPSRVHVSLPQAGSETDRE